MKEKKAMEAMRRWSGGEFAKAVAIFTRQAALDPELAAQFQDEAMLHYIENKLFRSDELMPAIEARLKKGSW
jgi:Tfp pilus assembly protein PilF